MFLCCNGCYHRSRFTTIQTISDRFSFIWNAHVSDDKLHSKSTELSRQYPNDLDAEVLADEIQSMRRLMLTLFVSAPECREFVLALVRRRRRPH